MGVLDIFHKGKSTIDKLQEEKARIELKMLHTKKVVPKPKSIGIVEESPEDYGRRLMKHRRNGLY